MADFYDSVTFALDATPLGEWSRFLNYGYADSPDDQSSVRLPASTLDRLSVKLVLELIGNGELDGRRILDVGSGRGGTIATLLDHFTPESATGVELSPAACAFARRTARDSRSTFLVADAQHLPFQDASFDVVTNVESAHCYPDIDRFDHEVLRVLTPGGAFFYTDILPASSLADRRARLRSLGLGFEVDRDITAQVLDACDQTAKRRLASFATAKDPMLRDFLAIEGSPTYEAMRNRENIYVMWRLRLAMHQ
jgi:ubiquinone/menaquinone biosynthesis C-methylase UbiE